MSSALYKQNTNFTHSTGSFLQSAPVELTTVSGYQEFLKKQEKKNYEIQTVLSEDKSHGYVLKDGEVIANIIGEAKDYLLIWPARLERVAKYLFDTSHFMHTLICTLIAGL